MAKGSTRVTGNDKAVADPGGTRPRPKPVDKQSQKVKSGDRNDSPTKPGDRTAKPR